LFVTAGTLPLLLLTCGGNGGGDVVPALRGGIGGGCVEGFLSALLAFARTSGSRDGALSTISPSSALRASDPGGGGGSVFCFRRGCGAGSGSGAASLPSGSTVHPDARSAIRPFVSSETRRRVRSSSGTAKR
jgi:hypothetical protein